MSYVLIALVLAAIAAAVLVAGRWLRVLRELSRGLEAPGAGGRMRQILIEVGDPVGRLVGAFNEAAPAIQGRVDRLEEDRQQLRVVLGAMAEAVIAVDSRRRLLFANTSADALFGLDATSVGRLVPELIRSPQVQSAVDETLRLNHPDAYQGEVAFPLREAALAGRPGFFRCEELPYRAFPRRAQCWSFTT